MSVIWAIIAVLLVLWLAGLLMNLFGGLVHILLVAAAVLFVVNMFTSRTRA
jgi:hypothetical protein